METQDFMLKIRHYDKPMQKKLKKLGTIAIDIVETTPYRMGRYALSL